MISVKAQAGKLFAYLGTVIDKFKESAIEESEATLSEVKSQMSVAGSAVTYPIKWDSEKQRRFVITKLTKEGNLPYKRTDAYRNGWVLAAMPDGFALSNKHPAGAIGGTTDTPSWQSNIHRGRWPALMPIVFKAITGLAERILERLKGK
jgi:hypothetical protein